MARRVALYAWWQSGNAQALSDDSVFFQFHMCYHIKDDCTLRRPAQIASESSDVFGSFVLDTCAATYVLAETGQVTSSSTVPQHRPSLCVTMQT